MAYELACASADSYDVSSLSSRLRSMLAIAVMFVVFATVLAPVAADAQDDRTLVANVSVDAAAAGHNGPVSWQIDVLCQAEVGECGTTIIESQLSPGIVVTDVDLALAPGYSVVGPPPDSLVSGEPLALQFQRAGDLLDGETVTIVLHGRVGPDAGEGNSLDHTVLVGSTNTPSVSIASAPVVVANQANWNLQGFALGEVTIGRNETHRVAVCGPTQGNVVHDELNLTLELPGATVVVDRADGDETATGLQWTIPGITTQDLAAEHDGDLEAGRPAELCHEFFPALRWSAPDFALGETIAIAATLTDAVGGSVDGLCPLGCRLDAAPTLAASTTVIEAEVEGPASVNGGGIATWTIAFDASATVEDVHVPILDIAVASGRQLERLDVTALGEGVEAEVHASTDGAMSYAPEPVRTVDNDSASIDRSDFDAIVGTESAIDALQIRLVSPAGEPLLGAGQRAVVRLVTSPDPMQPAPVSAQTCAMATSANAASIAGRSCALAEVAAAAPVYGPVQSLTVAAPPTEDQQITTRIQVSEDNGAPVVDPVVGALLPAGFEFRGLDSAGVIGDVAPVPRPRVETTSDYNGSGQTLVQFRWDDLDEQFARHTFEWGPSQMRATGQYTPLELDLVWRVAAPGGHPMGADALEIAMTSATTPPASCPVGATLRDDSLGLGTAFVCAHDALTETASGASLHQQNLTAGIALLPPMPADLSTGSCDVTRVDDIDWTASPCAAPTTPNGRVPFRTEVTNTGNRNLREVWSYGMLPMIDDVGIDPDTWQTPRESEWAASLTGPIIVSGLPWDPIEPGDVEVEYSSAADPCRPELSESGIAWPTGCVDDWTSAPQRWQDVTAWRVFVPFDRSPFTGAMSYRIEGEFLVAADAAFDTRAVGAVSHAAFDTVDGRWIRTGAGRIETAVPPEADITAADPGLLPFDLALVAMVNADASPELHDGPDPSDRFAIDVEILNQGAPVDTVEVALHPSPGISVEQASGTLLTDDANALGWTVTEGSPAVLTLTGTLARADRVSVPVPFLVVPDWSREQWSERPLELVAEIARFDAAGSSTALVDHDSTPDRDPDNDVAPEGPSEPGDNVVTGDGQPDSGIEPDPIADDEDDHDVAGVPIWDLSLTLGLGDGQSPVLPWSDPTVSFDVVVSNNGERVAHDIEVEQVLPPGMRWVQSAQLIEATDSSTTIDADDTGRLTISRLDPGATAHWQVQVQAVDPSIYDFVFAASISGFASDDDPVTDNDALVQDLDGEDLAGTVSVALPWDVAIGLGHRATVGLPINTSTNVEVDLTFENVGRSIDLAVVDIDLASSGLVADTPDLSTPILDALGRPVRVTWDLNDPVRPRIQIERSDGTAFEHGAVVVVPVVLSVADATLEANAITVFAGLSGFSAPGDAPDFVTGVDANPGNDSASLLVPMSDVALSFADDTPSVNVIDDDVVAEWVVRVENQGNRDATDIVVDVAFGDRLLPVGDAPMLVPFLAPGEQVELIARSTFVDGFDGSFVATAQIMSFGDENRQQRGDADSRPGVLGDPGSTEDDEQRLERSLPAAVDLDVAHVATNGLPLVAGESSVRFDVSVRNAGRPLHTVEIVLDTGGFGPAIIDAETLSVDVAAGAAPGSLILTMPADAPLLPDAVVTLPVEISFPAEWDGTIPSLSVSAVDGDATARAAMSVWDLALEVDLASGQPDRLDPAVSTPWAITVHNEGNRPVRDVVVAIGLPSGMALVDLQGAAVTSEAAAGQTGEILAVLDRIAAGETTTFTVISDLQVTDRSNFRLGAEIVAFATDRDKGSEPDPLVGDIDSTPRAVAMAATADTDGASVNRASVSVAEDDQDHADAGLPADVAVALSLDSPNPPVAGSSAVWTIRATNQGLDLAQAIVAFELDDRWVWPDLASLPTVTNGASLAVSWDLSDPATPRAILTGSWLSGSVAELNLALEVRDHSSAAGTQLAIGVSIDAIDDDGFPATPPPQLDDIDDDRAARVALDLFDLALRVRIDPAVTLPPAAEQDVAFLVDVTNQGTVTADEIVVRLHPDDGQWQPLAESLLAVADASTPLEPGATRTVSVVLTLAPDADLNTAALVAEIASASLTDFDSTPDDDATNDSAPGTPGDATDDAIDNQDGDEDDHDVASLEPPRWVLGNQVWFDADRDGVRDEDEAPAEGVLLELLLDANGDGVADDRDLNGTIDRADRLATTVTDAAGLFRFDDVRVGQYLIAIPRSEFTGQGPLAGWSTTIRPSDLDPDGTNNGRLRSDGGVTSATIVVSGTGPLAEAPNNAGDLPDTRTNLTVDFGLAHWSLGNQVWFDTVENGLFDAGEQGVGGARLHLYADANQDGRPDDVNADGALNAVDALATTIADDRGRYRFDGLGAATYLVAVADTTMRGQLGDWAISRFSRAVEPGRDNDSNAAGWNGFQVLSSPIRLGEGPAVDLTLDFGFELAETAPIVWPDVDLTGFNNPTWTYGGNEPAFFGPGLDDDLTSFDDFGDVDIFGGDDPFGADGFDFVDDAFFEDNPAGPIAYTGANTRTLVSWAAMLIVFGAVLVGVSREPEAQ